MRYFRGSIASSQTQDSKTIIQPASRWNRLQCVEALREYGSRECEERAPVIEEEGWLGVKQGHGLRVPRSSQSVLLQIPLGRGAPISSRLDEQICVSSFILLKLEKVQRPRGG